MDNEMPSPGHERISRLAVALILGSMCLLAFVVRMLGIGFGLPASVHADEFRIVDRVIEMINTGSLNPAWFNYGSLSFYLQGTAYLLVYGVGRACGIYTDFDSVPISTIYMTGRSLTVIMSVATILATYLAGRRLVGPRAGLLAALFITVSPLHLVHSYYITVDSPMTFWITLSFLASLSIYQAKARKPWSYVLNGVFIGLAISTKYNAVWAIVPMLVAHILNSRSLDRPIRDRCLKIGLACVPLAFLISAPYSLLDVRNFARSVRYERLHYSQGHEFAESKYTSHLYYAHALIRGFGGVQTALAGMGAILLWQRQRRMIYLLCCFPLVYYLFVGSYRVRFDRNVICLIPFLSILAGCGLAWTLSLLLQLRGARFSRLVNPCAGLLMLVTMIGVAFQARSAMAELIEMTLPDTRGQAQLWIEANLPVGSHIARDGYTPTPSKKLFQITRFGHSKLWMATPGDYDYLITSSLDYGPYFRQKDDFKDKVAGYQRIFNECELIREFKPLAGKVTGPTVQIYRPRVLSSSTSSPPP